MGDPLKPRRFRILADIVQELVGEGVFPTGFDAVNTPACEATSGLAFDLDTAVRRLGIKTVRSTSMSTTSDSAAVLRASSI